MIFGKSRLFVDPWRDGTDTTLYAIQALLRLPTKLVRPSNQEASRAWLSNTLEIDFRNTKVSVLVKIDIICILQIIIKFACNSTRYKPYLQKPWLSPL